MKIAIFSSDNNIASGAFRAEINLINDLKNKGHDVTLVVPYRGSGQKSIRQNKINNKIIFSVFWICLLPKTIIDYLFYFLTLPINIIARIRTKRFLKRNHFDLVAVNTVWNGIGGEVAEKLSIPVVWHLREMLEKGQHRRFFNQKKSYNILNNANLLLPVSEAVYHEFASHINKNKMKVVYDGVKKESFYQPKKQLFKDKKIHILLLGRIGKEKGQHVAIQALNELSQYDFDIKIVGRGSPFYKHKLIKLAPHIKERITFIGVTNDVNKYYRQADLFLMNSIGEAFGLVTVEAMLNGLSVIAARCDGTAEIIGSGQNGYFYKPFDVDNLKRQLTHVFNHPNEAKQKAKRGQTYVHQKFLSEVNSSSVEKMYMSVLKNTN